MFLILKKIITFFSNIIFELQQQEAKGKLDNLKYLKLRIRKNKINEENFTQYSLYYLISNITNIIITIFLITSLKN